MKFKNKDIQLGYKIGLLDGQITQMVKKLKTEEKELALLNAEYEELIRRKDSSSEEEFH